jgi:glucose uptake protein
MILPHTYIVTLLVLFFSMACWGSWANTQKMTGKWRFELFYFDYAFGVLLVALVCAFTLGSLGYDGFSFLDDVMNGGKQPSPWPDCRWHFRWASAWRSLSGSSGTT